MDSQKIANILTKGLEETKKDIQANLASSGRNASGKTSNSLRVSVEINPDRVTGMLLGSSVLERLEFGRGKTVNAGSSATWEKELRDWMRIRGIDQSAFYPIWRKINAEGYDGTKGLVTDPITKFKKSFAKELKGIIIKDLRSNGINNNQ